MPTSDVTDDTASQSTPPRRRGDGDIPREDKAIAAARRPGKRLAKGVAVDVDGRAELRPGPVKTQASSIRRLLEVIADVVRSCAIQHGFDAVAVPSLHSGQAAVIDEAGTRRAAYGQRVPTRDLPVKTDAA